MGSDRIGVVHLRFNGFGQLLTQLNSASKTSDVTQSAEILLISLTPIGHTS